MDGLARRMRELATEPELGPADPAELIRKTVAFVQPEIAERKVQLELSLPESLGTAQLDAAQLRQVLINLVVNALEAMTDGGKLQITATRLPDEVVIEIRDTGSGLCEQASQDAFEPFFTTKEDGTGLGLAISRSIVDRHGGKLTLRNATAGGAVAELRLPVLSCPS